MSAAPDWLMTGLRLTAFGMGLVFLLLGLLWALVAVLLRTDRPAPEAEPRAEREKRTAAARSSAGPPPLDPDVLAAVMIAVRAHIRVRRKQAAPAMRSHRPGSLPGRWLGIGRSRQIRSER